MREQSHTTVTVECPIKNEYLSLDTQYLFEVIRQKISEAMEISADDVWIKSINSITEYDVGKEVTGEA